MLIDAVSAIGSTAQRPGGETRRLREVTGRVMGSVFYGTMFKMMRDSTLKGAFGHGGRGEEIFQAQLHAILSERMGQRTQRGPGEVLYNKLKSQQERLSAGTVGDGTREWQG